VIPALRIHLLGDFLLGRRWATSIEYLCTAIPGTHKGSHYIHRSSARDVEADRVGDHSQEKAGGHE
jgi:hypothetical protein